MSNNIVSVYRWDGGISVELNGREIPEAINVQSLTHEDDPAVEEGKRIILVSFYAAQFNDAGKPADHTPAPYVDPELAAMRGVPEVAVPQQDYRGRFVLIDPPPSRWQRINQLRRDLAEAFERWQNGDRPPHDY